ncbi:MAG: hypothetical protein R3A45_11355 [Bdellovibrionota bacterium]
MDKKKHMVKSLIISLVLAMVIFYGHAAKAQCTILVEVTSNDQPISSALVLVKGSFYGDWTEANGRVRLSINVENGKTQPIVVTKSGYHAEEVNASCQDPYVKVNLVSDDGSQSDEQQTLLDTKLKEDPSFFVIDVISLKGVREFEQMFWVNGQELPNNASSRSHQTSKIGASHRFLLDSNLLLDKDAKQKVNLCQVFEQNSVSLIDIKGARSVIKGETEGYEDPSLIAVSKQILLAWDQYCADKYVSVRSLVILVSDTFNNSFEAYVLDLSRIDFEAIALKEKDVEQAPVVNEPKKKKKTRRQKEINVNTNTAPIVKTTLQPLYKLDETRVIPIDLANISHEHPGAIRRIKPVEPLMEFIQANL